MEYRGLAIVLATSFLWACQGGQTTTESTEEATAEETTEVEWITLFDGTDLSAWKGYMTDEVGSNWRIEEGILIFEESDPPQDQDLITKEEFENFEFELEWMISEGGNSGIFYMVKETDKYNESYYTSPEMQILDNERHEDAQIPKHRAGDLYDLISCATETVKPAGEWNKVRIVKDNGRIEQWLNDVKVVETELWTDEWNEMVAGSKFSDWEDFAKSKSGRIGLQDHENKVSFRNIRIRRL